MPSAGKQREASPEGFPFRPWVRSTCRKAMVWGIGVLALLAGVVWLLRSPDDGGLGKAVGVLLGYAILFWATLLKIWWTAGRPAVEVGMQGISHQPLHTFRPRFIPWTRILACAPRPGTESLRLVVKESQRGKELYLNLAVVRGKHRLLDVLGEHLSAAGLQPDEEGTGWRLPGWEE